MSETSVKVNKKTDIVKVMLALLAILLATYMFVDPGKQNFQANPSDVHLIDSLDSINKRLIIANHQLDSLVSNYNQKIVDLDGDIARLKHERGAYSRMYMDLLNDAKNDTPGEIDSFFMNRYQY